MNNIDNFIQQELLESNENNLNLIYQFFNTIITNNFNLSNADLKILFLILSNERNQSLNDRILNSYLDIILYNLTIIDFNNNNNDDTCNKIEEINNLSEFIYHDRFKNLNKD